MSVTRPHPPAACVDDTASPAGMESLHMAPLGRHARDLLPSEPHPTAVPHLWRRDSVRSALFEELDLGGAADAERRVTLLLNPGYDGLAAPSPTIATTSTMLAGVQMLLPGERAPAHRHTAAALRFVIEGRGARTVTDGEPAALAPGDMVVTPSWTWHDHESQASEPVLWLDVLDVPLVLALEAGFFEPYPATAQPARSAPDGSRFPWADARQRLATMASTPRGPGMLQSTYLDDQGGPVTRTLGCRAHMLPPGKSGTPVRETASSIFYVVEGRGTSVVSGTGIAWCEGDIFVVPGWAESLHTNADESSPAFLFSVNDEPAMRALGLYRTS